MAGFLVLVWASLWDLNTATIHDIHWTVFGAAGILYSYLSGFFIEALPFVAVLVFGGAVLHVLGKWGEGDVAVLGGLGFYVYPEAELFAYTFIGTTFLYFWIHRMLGFEKARFIPVFLITFITVFGL